MTSLPTMKALSNRVLRECAVPEVSTFVSANPQATMAYDAVLDAYADVWFRNRWEWQRYEASIALVEGQEEYPLPANFHRLAQPPTFPPTHRATGLREFSPEEFYRAVGNLDPTQNGQPVAFTIDHTTIQVWPAPSGAMITAAPAMTLQYWLALPARKTTAQESHALDYMPADFEELLTCYAKSKVKQYLEFPDFERDMQIYEKKLQIMMNRNRQGRRAPRFRTAFDGIVEW